jgi:hypothetical protein
LSFLWHHPFWDRIDISLATYSVVG